jgi:peptidoglycan/xylan/chitin deacetylase (PgdA/CDA1 family)
VQSPNTIKRLAHKVAGSSGLTRLFRFRFRNQLLVLGYHGICGERPDVSDPARVHVPARLLEAQLRALLDHYQPVSLGQVFGHFATGAPLPDRPLLITFDDGYRNVLSNGLPILRSLKIPCAFFPIVSAVESGEWPWFARLAYHSNLDTSAFLRLGAELMVLSTAERTEWLTRNGFAGGYFPDCDHSICRWDELAAAVAGGWIEIGSHSMTHAALDLCRAQELTYELTQARILLQHRLNIRVDAVAYPFGRCSPQVCSAAAAAGYKLGFLTNGRHAEPNDQIMEIPRVLIGPDDTPTILLSRISGWTETIRV